MGPQPNIHKVFKVLGLGKGIGIDEIIVMEDGKAEVTKSAPKIREKAGKAAAKDESAAAEQAGAAGRRSKPKQAAAPKRQKIAAAKPAAKKRAARAKKAAAAPAEPEAEKDDIRKKDVQEIVKGMKPPSKDAALSVVEAALFMANKPLMLDELAKISGIGSLGYLKQLLEQLQKEYENRGMEIMCNRSGWRMHVRQHLLQHVAHLTPYSDIPEGCKKTLALVVYKEPMRQSDLIRIQGNKAYTYIKQLKRSGLLRSEKKGRSLLLKLTQEFNRYFGEERDKIREAMVKEFGDPSQVFAEPQKPEPVELQKGAPKAN